ncbi:MAG: amidohydrolase family protein [Saprospirales bacterium]|nr:amidohydrolase family protein [Saprospirales bacterium]
MTIRFSAPSLFLCVLFFLPILVLRAQQTYPQAAPSDHREGVYAFTNATIFVDYRTSLTGATLVIGKGKVVACGQNVLAPKDAVVVDCSGKTIYPGLIDIYAAGYGLPAPKAEGTPAQQRPQQYTGKKGAFAWNEALKSEFIAAEAFAKEEKAAAEWRKLGFGAVLTHRPDGISRGAGVLVTLSDEREHESILLARASHHLSMRKGASTQDYPSSLMGVVALIRQTYLDAEWYQNGGSKDEQNLSLEAWINLQRLPQIFEAADKLDVLRIARIGQEFGRQFLVKTTGDEYQRLDEVKATGQGLIVPLEFPEPAADIANPYDALHTPLRTLKHWEMAPSNPARLAAAGIPFALTAFDLRDKKQFWTNLRKAVEYGLSPEAALMALTWQPAQFLQVYDKLGSLEPGKTANFFITTGDMFKAEAKILDTWVQGKPYAVTEDNADAQGLFGTYQLQAGPDAYVLTVKGKPEALEASLMRADSSRIKANLVFSNGLVTLIYQPDSTTKAYVSLSGEARQRSWSGRGVLPNGSWINWTAERTGDAPADKPKRPEKAPVAPEMGEMTYPFAAYGWRKKPQAGTYLIQNATVWTNERDGILRHVDVLISNGKIQRIGRRLPVQDNAVVVDGSGKHLTAGIIDEHSHIAVARSVNEGTQESAAEVRIGDALDSEDIDIYRQLAGGVTSSHLLHGSANPIGGQTQLIKLRWGAAPEALKFPGWTGQIKFALGENVKQSNWGDNNRTRYPQTRMGVEQVYVDYFTRAQEYGRLKRSGKPYRKDLELDALLEILESKRFITCHSYVQSEITMLMRVAEKFGFRVNTFTHILEGYKVADKMARHGAGGSTFSDWWAYKFEVFQAIPYNAAMMHRQGVLVSINSDDAEMARRLNQEAAKAVMYGGVSEEDAWKMVTLNPAKLLHVDDRVGSVKVGKDADLVLWSDNPLSVYANAEKTWVDGIPYFDRAEDLRMREWIRQERARILQKMQADKKPGASGAGGERPARPREHYHCDSVEDEG